jgi:Mu-like prophage I protein
MLNQTAESLPRFVSTLAAPLAPQEQVRVPLALSGRWVRGAREFAITRQDLESIVRNFQYRQNGEINVDYDHASEMPEVAAGGPIPSAGRIVRIDAPEILKSGNGKPEAGNGEGPDSRLPASNSRHILYGWYEPTARARQLIAQREYRYISPAIDWGARSKRTGRPLGATLSSVALTNRPFLEEMPPLRLSDPEYRLAEQAAPQAPLSAQEALQPSEKEIGKSRIEDEPASFDLPVSNFHFPVSNAGGDMKKVQLSVVDGNVKVVHEDQEFSADPEQVITCAAALAPAARGGVPAERAAAPGAEEAPPAAPPLPLPRAGQLLSEADAAGKSISALEFFRGEVDREVESAVRCGKILPRRRDDWRKIALADLPAFRRLMSDQKPLVPLTPVGFAGTPPEGVPAQVKLLAEERMRERHISFGQALAEIGREQPELAREYRRAVTRSDTAQ